MLTCRQIAEPDLPAIITLLTRGFPKRNPAFWQSALELLGAHEPAAPFPRYGYVMDNDGTLVGVILTIATAMPDGIRCNTSSWYVEPKFRAMASLFTRMTRTHKDATTFVNVTPAEHTVRTIEAQGFKRYAAGEFMAIPLLSKPSCRGVVINAKRLPPLRRRIPS